MIDFRVLGALDLRHRTRKAPVSSLLVQPKRLALLVYLVLAPTGRPRRRDALLAMFWPDSTEERARNSLNQTVFNLRRSLGDGVVVGSAEELGIARDLVQCDALEFEEAASEGKLERAYDVYAGELLPGFHVEDCADFERWLAAERERLRGQAVRVALKLADEREQLGNPVGAVEPVRRALAWAPYDEGVASRLLSLLARLGDRPGAVQEYERFRELLAADLSLEVSPELRAQVEELRRGDQPRIGAENAAPAASAASHAPSGELAVAISPATMNGGIGAGTRKWTWSASAVLGALLMVALLLYRTGREEDAPGAAAGAPALDARRVVVAPFENRTGDPALDPLGFMAADWIAQGLALTAMVRVVPFSTVVQQTIQPQTAGAGGGHREFARRLGAGLLVEGGYYRSGAELVFQGRVVDVASGEMTRALEVTRGSSDRPAAAAEELQRRTMAALAAMFDERLESWPDPASQPSNLEAYRLFSDGMDAFMQGMNHYRTAEGTRLFSSAAERFVSAAAVDSAFVTTLLWAVYAYQNAGDAATASTLIAELQRRPLSPWSHAVLRHQTASDAEEVYRAARDLAELSPDSEWLFTLGVAAYRTGRIREARSAFLRLDPERGWVRGWNGYWRLRTEIQHVGGHHEQALKDAERALREFPDDHWLQLQELWALAALGRTDQVLERVGPRIAAGDAHALWQLTTTIEELRGHGHRAGADRVLRRAIPLAQPFAATRSASDYAYLLRLAGRYDEADELYRLIAARQPDDAAPRIGLAVLALRRGDRIMAREAIRWLESLAGDALRRALPAAQERYWGSPEAWRLLTVARLHARLGDHDRAVQALRASLEHGLAHGFLHLHDDPDFDPLRGLPAFRQLLASRG